MELVHELHDWFKEANGKKAICCRVLTKEFNMGQGEHKRAVYLLYRTLCMEGCPDCLSSLESRIWMKLMSHAGETCNRRY